MAALRETAPAAGYRPPPGADPLLGVVPQLLAVDVAERPGAAARYFKLVRHDAQCAADHGSCGVIIEGMLAP